MQILREINYGHFETPKITILTILAALNFDFLGIFDIFKYVLLKNQNSKCPKLL